MSAEIDTHATRWLRRLLIPSLFALMAVGIVLALDYFVTVPVLILGVTLVVGALSLAAFAAGAWSVARASGVGVFRAAGRAVLASIRIVIDLF